MYSRFYVQCILLAALVSATHASIMVKSVDGSFVPWRFFPRAPGDGSVPVALTNNGDFSYLATVLMGTPQQQVPMAPSLAQNFISVASPPPGVDASSYYNPSVSSSYMPSSQAATIQTPSGESFAGQLAGETCTVGSADSSASFAYNASIVTTDSSVSSAFYPPGANGVLGYGVNLPSGLPTNASLISSFLPPNFTGTAVCGIELNHMDDPVPNGVLTMGAVDPTAFTGNFTNVTVPSDSQFSWSIPFDKLTYLAGNASHDLSGVVASIDMLQTCIQVPTSMAQQVYSGMPDSKPISATEWSMPCDSKFPITLTFGGKPFTINERDTIQQLSDGTCKGVITGGGDKFASVGAPFLRNFYTQFGLNKPSNGSATFFVGFASKVLRSSE